MPFDHLTLALMDRYWRAANYLSVGQIYLMDNPLLAEPLKAEHVKPRLLRHWGHHAWSQFHLCPLSRIIREHVTFPTNVAFAVMSRRSSLSESLPNASFNKASLSNSSFYRKALSLRFISAGEARSWTFNAPAWLKTPAGDRFRCQNRNFLVI